MVGGVNGPEGQVIGGIRFDAKVESSQKNQDGIYTVKLASGSVFTFKENTENRPGLSPEIKEKVGNNAGEYSHITIKNCQLETLEDNPDQNDSYNLMGSDTKINKMTISKGQDMVFLNGATENAVNKIDYRY